MSLALKKARESKKTSTGEEGGKKESKRAQIHAGLVFPVGRINSAIKKTRLFKNVSPLAGIAATAVLEYLTAEIMEITHAAMPAEKKRMTNRAIILRIQDDVELADLLKNTISANTGVRPCIHRSLIPKKREKPAKAEDAEKTNADAKKVGKKPADV